MFDKAFWGNMKLYSLRQLKQDEYNYCANAPRTACRDVHGV